MASKTPRGRPSKLVILGNPVIVRYTVPISAPELGTFETSPTGDLVISLCPDLDEEILRKVLLHECVHAILHISGLTNLVTDQIEEAIVTAIENGLYPIMRSHY